MSPETRRYALEKITNFIGAAAFLAFAYSLATDFLSTHRPSSLVSLALVTLFAGFFLARGLPRQSNLSPYDWTIALAGTYAPLFFRPAPEVHDLLALQILQIAGGCISIAGILSLNKSIGIVAANRGVKTFWAYKFVRHPIYTGYFITFGSFWAQNMTASNTVVLIVFMMFETLRMFAEEEHLAQDPAYRDYMQKTRWRLLPYVF